MLGEQDATAHLPTWWPARPTRCSALATLGGDSIWMTRSTAPMSMPSSRLLVATTEGSRPRLRSSSISARCSLETEPWWAFAITASAPVRCPGLRHDLRGLALSPAARPPARVVAISLSRAVSRSARRRELAKTIVERCCSMRSATCSSTWGQIEPLRPSSGSSSASSWSPSGAVMSSTGTTTLRSHCFSAGRRDDVDRRGATEEAGDLLEGAHRRGEPDPLGGRSRRASSRSRLTARWAPACCRPRRAPRRR